MGRGGFTRRFPLMVAARNALPETEAQAVSEPERQTSLPPNE
jgi:hypothetical protein